VTDSSACSDGVRAPTACAQTLSQSRRRGAKRASSADRGLAATSRSSARRLRGAGEAGERRLRRRGCARGRAGRRRRRASARARAGRRSRRPGGRGAHAGGRPGKGEQGQDGQHQGRAWRGRRRRRQRAEDARGGQARRALGGRADAWRHAVALHAVRALTPRERRCSQGSRRMACTGSAWRRRRWVGGNGQAEAAPLATPWWWLVDDGCDRTRVA